nr:retrovirus-related Pol polyprotein from transposon TNT 1-94 [Tanacetum cinerariifolium]
MKHSRIPLHKVSAATPKSKPVLSVAFRTIGAARPTFSKTRPYISPYTVSKSNAPIRRPFIRHTTPKPRLFPARVNAANSAVSAARVNAANSSAVSAARVNAANSAVSAARFKAARLFAVNAARINAVKPSAVTVVQHHHTKKGDSLFPIPFWAEAINTACYVQNRVLVTKPHNKTPYELLHGRLPSIGFMRPFGCPVTILNTLDPLGKFQRKVDEGFLVGYSVYSKAFRVFNSRTRIVQETLHVNFMENKPNVAGFGPAWLFDIDSLSQTMNYHSVLAENQSNPTACFQDTSKAGEEGTQTYVLFPVLSDGSTNPKNNKDAHTCRNEHNDDFQKSVSPSCGDQAKEQCDKDVNKDKGKSPVVTITRFRDLNEKFTECINNSSKGVTTAGPLVSADGLEFTSSINDFTTASPLVSAAEFNYTNSTNDVSAAGPSNADMPNLDDFSHNEDNVGAEADTNNMEFIIPVSPIPTTRIHKDHPISQIIGDLSLTTQTRSMAKGVRDQGRISQMFNEDFHTWQTATGKESSNPFMAGSLPKTIVYSFLHKIYFHFWNTAVVKRMGDVTMLQALVDKKKIVIFEDAIREILQLNDAKGVVCLPNDEIFVGLARMGYEKPSTKLTFYKAFFSSQWKFLIHTILQSLSAKRTSWNEFSTAMASAVICLSKGQRFNFSRFDANMRFLLKSKEEMEKEEEEIIKSINETPAQKAAKRRRLREQAKEDENLKKQLEVVADEDDDVFVEATPIGTKVHVVNYEVVMINNKPWYKIFKADDTHQLYTSFITLLKNFDREGLEYLWKIVKARFSTSKPTNFTDDYLLVTLKNMFKKTYVQDVIWRSQQTEHGQALVKSWKLLTSCGVHIITFTTTMFILLVEKKYPLSRFTLEQLVNVARVKLFRDAAAAAHMNKKGGCDELGFSAARLSKFLLSGKSQMGYEKPSTKLTFYKAFFSSQWKFLIHTILHSLSAKRTSWNEFSTAMAYTVICLSKGQRFNFSRVEGLESANTAQQLEILKLKARVKKLERLNKGRKSVDIDKGIELVDVQEKDAQVKGRQADTQAEIYNIDLDHTSKVLSMQEDSEVQEVVEVVNAAKLITEVVTAAATQVIPAAKSVVAVVSTPASTAKPKVLKVVPAALTVSTRKRKGVVIRDPEEKLHDDTPTKTQFAKDKGKGILVEDPKPMKKKDQIAMDAEYARKLQEEEVSLAQTTDAQATDVQPKDVPAKGIQYIKRYHGYKKKPQSESEARKNMIDYLKNTEGFKLAFFKGKTYDQIRPIFQARFDANMKFLLKSKEEMEKEEEEIIKSINETPAQKAAKRRRLREQAKEAEDLKKQLEVVPDEDDDVFIEATLIGTKVPVVNYEIAMINNKPRYKIFRVDDTHQLYTSFITLLKNFDREDLEDLWKIMKTRFSTSKPTNWTDDYLLATLKHMFEKTDAQDVLWRS